MWAAIRYRRAQAAVLMVLAALITVCGVFAALYERGLEQALLHTALDRAAPAELALTVSAGRTAAFAQTVPSNLEANVPAQARALYGEPVGMITNPVDIVPRDGLKPSPADIISRTDVCKHLRITVGECPDAPDEVLVSAKDLAAWKWTLGQKLGPGRAPDGPGAPEAPPLVVVGAYEVLPDPAYWMRTQIDGKSGTLINIGLEQVPALDTLVTDESTFTKEWNDAGMTLTFPLRRNLIALDTLDQVTAALNAKSTRQAGQGVSDATITSQLPGVIDGIRIGQQRVRVIVPLLMAQLGLLAAAILLLVAQAAVEQRRPEMALARLRGRSRDSAGRLVMAELGLTVALGVPLGFGVALGLNELVRRTVLPAGVPFEIPLLALVGAAAAAVVCALAIWLAARPVRRLAVSALLRRVAPPRGRALGIVDILAVALAAFGLVGLSTGSLNGPLALITPTLIALAAGLVASRLAVPLAGASGRANLKRGRIAPALTAFGLERRPAMRKVVTILSVAVALTVFAANALVVADRNWTARAQMETGAPAVLDTDADNPVQFARAVKELDPSGAKATPVAVVRRTDSGSAATLAVMGSQWQRVAFRSPEGLRLGGLTPPATQPVQLRGNRVTGTVSWKMSSVPADSYVLPPGQSGFPNKPGEVPADLTRTDLILVITTPAGQRLNRLLMQVPSTGTGSLRLDAPLLCPDGCRLDGLQLRKSDLTREVAGSLSIKGFGVDGTSLKVSSPDHWNQQPPQSRAPEDKLAQTSGDNDTLTLELSSQGGPLDLTHADVPTVVPGLLAGPVPPGGDASAFPASGLNGAPITVGAEQRPGSLPVVGAKGVLIDYETLARIGGTVPGSGTLSVWLKDPSAAERSRVTAALAEQGITVTNHRTFADAKEKLDQSASAWGLRLAAFTGAMAVLLAAIVIIVMAVTGWRVVARDLAALHLAGVPLRDLRRSLVREQVLVVLAGAVVGAVCGAVSSWIAMPLVPLFDSEATPVPAVDLVPSLAAVAGSAVAAALVVAVIGVFSAVGIGRRVRLSRVREAV